ncbi:MAG: hypothetical protein ACKOB4_10260, partial [Acidobacteriota bacterium]
MGRFTGLHRPFHDAGATTANADAADIDLAVRTDDVAMNIMAEGDGRPGSEPHCLDKIPSLDLLTHYFSPRERLGIENILVVFKKLGKRT